MPEILSDKKVFTLLEVTKSIQKTLAERYKGAYWIKAEMNKLNFYSHSGHCYPELVEKVQGKVIAQIKCNLWKDDYQHINNKFLNILKEPLKDGIKILFLAKISFDPAHGLALQIIDIDPAYTLGDLEKEKQETIKRMKEEGIFNSNKTLQIPLLPQRIAIISVETSKGYADFLGVLQTNSWNYHFFHMLFPSLLQGEKAVDSIIRQLKRIEKVKSHFDVVAIIRGGGGDVGLSCYNNYELAKAIALFPIPVITGIGHATNETVVEMISFSNAITPTKIAEYLLQEFHNFSVPVQKAREIIADKSGRLLSDEKTKFQSELKLFRSVTENILIHQRNQIREQVYALVRQSVFLFKNEKEYLGNLKENIKKGTFSFCGSVKQEIRQLSMDLKKDTLTQLVTSKLMLDNLEKNISNMSPKNVLKRGYSITLHNGKAVKSFKSVKVDDQLETVVFDGNIHSIVKSSQKPTE
jgi:exodeoxyribonuclease VII large subunit